MRLARRIKINTNAVAPCPFVTTALIALRRCLARISVGAVYGVLGGLVSLFWAALFAHTCVWWAPSQYRMGMYNC